QRLVKLALRIPEIDEKHALRSLVVADAFLVAGRLLAERDLVSAHDDALLEQRQYVSLLLDHEAIGLEDSLDAGRGRRGDGRRRDRRVLQRRVPSCSGQERGSEQR